MRRRAPPPAFQGPGDVGGRWGSLGGRPGSTSERVSLSLPWLAGGPQEAPRSVRRSEESPKRSPKRPPRTHEHPRSYLCWCPRRRPRMPSKAASIDGKGAVFTCRPGSASWQACGDRIARWRLRGVVGPDRRRMRQAGPQAQTSICAAILARAGSSRPMLRSLSHQNLGPELPSLGPLS